jgi:hypothetical protein
MPSSSFVTSESPKMSFVRAQTPDPQRLPNLSRIVIASPGSAGMDARPSARHLDLRRSPRISNFRLDGTELQKHPGLTIIGAALPDEPLRLLEWTDAFGNRRVVALTQDRPYFFDGTNWVDISAGAPADIFTGDNTNLFDWAGIASDTAPAGLDAQRNLFVVANGIDAPRAWDGDTATFFTTVTNAPICRYVAPFADRMFAAYVTIGGTTRGDRLMWCVNGNIIDWSGTGSGSADRPISGGVISGIKPLRGALALYLTNGIETILRRSESATVPIEIQPYPGPGLGLVCPYTLAALPSNEHIFLGSDFNVYRYDLTYPRAIGNEIQQEIKAAINQNRLGNAFAFTVDARAEYYLYIPVTTDTTFPSRAYVYNWIYETWTRIDIPATCGASLTDTAGATTIDGLIGTIDGLDAVSATIDGLNSSGTSVPPKLYLGFSDKSINRLAEGTFTYTLSADPKNITAFIDIPPTDFEEAGRMKTLQRVIIRYKDTGFAATVEVQVSTDNGVTFSAVRERTTAATGSGATRELFFDVRMTAESFLVRVRQATPTNRGFTLVEAEMQAQILGETFV